MKKQVLVVGIIVMFLAVGLSGCTENNQKDGSTELKDSDGDGLTDEQEDYLGTNNETRDSDGDGVYDYFETTDDTATIDTDDDGVIDALDIDDDNDGVPTHNENPDPNKDGDPADAQDTDEDGIPDYLDPNGKDDVPDDSNGGEHNFIETWQVLEKDSENWIFYNNGSLTTISTYIDHVTNESTTDTLFYDFEIGDNKLCLIGQGDYNSGTPMCYDYEFSDGNTVLTLSFGGVVALTLSKV